MDIVGKTIQNGEPTPEHPVDIENKINLTGAIQILNKLKSKVTLVKVDDENNSEKEYRLPFLMNIEQQAIETVLSELEKKEAIINEMAKRLVEAHGWFYSEFDNFTEKDWIDYCRKKVTDINVGDIPEQN